MHPRLRTAAALVVVLSAALLAAGCGSGGKDIADVKSCLKKLDMTVEGAPKDDKDVREGVFATSNLTGDDAAKDFTFAMAANVKDEDRIEDFEKQSKDFGKSAAADGKLEIKSGSDGEYVWVAGGAKGSGTLDDARDCVEP
jgi:hypothetical protein